ncbi:spc97 spc98 family protein, partial [Cystoisospora suis]
MAISAFEASRQEACDRLIADLVSRHLSLYLDVSIPKEKQEKLLLELKSGVIEEDDDERERKNREEEDEEEENRIVAEENFQTAFAFIKSYCHFHSFGTINPREVHEEIVAFLSSLESLQQVLRASELRSLLHLFLDENFSFSSLFLSSPTREKEEEEEKENKPNEEERPPSSFSPLERKRAKEQKREGRVNLLESCRASRVYDKDKRKKNRRAAYSREEEREKKYGILRLLFTLARQPLLSLPQGETLALRLQQERHDREARRRLAREKREVEEEEVIRDLRQLQTRQYEEYLED